jgi:type IX secretion system PorP/SprF family membrane protein
MTLQLIHLLSKNLSMATITRMLTFILVFSTLCTNAQDPIFSQHFAAPLNINPAFAGVTTAPRINLSYRNQWPSWPNAYRTYAVSYDHPVEIMNSGFGVMAMTDDAGNGIYKTNSFMGTYSYQVQASKDLFLRLGFEAGIEQTRLDWEQLVFADQLDPRIGLEEGTFSAEVPPDQFNRTTFDLGTGLLVYHTNYYGGISLKHINRADESWLNINQNLNLGRPMRLTLHAGAEFSVNAGNNRLGASFISPNLLYIRQGPFTQVNVGAYAGYERVFGGLWYRHTSENADAAILLAGFRYGVLRIAYSYDVTISGLSVGSTGGSHEISVSFNLADSRILQQKRKRNETINCFKIFN